MAAASPAPPGAGVVMWCASQVAPYPASSPFQPHAFPIGAMKSRPFLTAEDMCRTMEEYEDAVVHHTP